MTSASLSSPSSPPDFPHNRWLFALTPGRIVGVIAELVGAILPFAGCYLVFLGHAKLGIHVGALGLMATAGLIVQAERRRGDPISAILRDAQTFRDTPELAKAQRAYEYLGYFAGPQIVQTPYLTRRF